MWLLLVVASEPVSACIILSAALRYLDCKINNYKVKAIAPNMFLKMQRQATSKTLKYKQLTMKLVKYLLDVSKESITFNLCGVLFSHKQVFLTKGPDIFVLNKSKH